MARSPTVQVLAARIRTQLNDILVEVPADNEPPFVARFYGHLMTQKTPSVGVAGKTIKLVLDTNADGTPDTISETYTAVTDATGYYSINYTINAPGTTYYATDFAGDTQYFGTEPSKATAVRTGAAPLAVETPWVYYAVAAAGVAVVLYWLLRKKK